MEFTYQSTMQLPASYAVLSEDEMVYTVGGAFELNINAQDVLNFTVNVGVNLVRMLGQAAISNTIAGIIDMRNDGRNQHHANAILTAIFDCFGF